MTLRQRKDKVLLAKVQVKANWKYQETLFGFVSFKAVVKKLETSTPQGTPVFLEGLSQAGHESSWWVQNE